MNQTKWTGSEKAIAVLTVGLLIVLTFPVYALGNSPTPMILGMPFAMFWVVFWIVVQFVALVIIYRLEHRGKDES